MNETVRTAGLKSSRAATASSSTSPSGYAIETSFSASESESSRV